MDGALPSDCVTVAVLASRAGRHAPEHLDGVLAWTGSGVRHYQPVSATVPDPGGEGAELAGLDPAGLTASPPTSSGLTWRTWALPTIPPAIRHLPPAEAVQLLAGALRRVTP